jgi:catechol 1,2-dioxygenase
MPEYTVDSLLHVVNSAYTRPGDARVRAIAERMIGDFYRTIQDFDVTHDEMWAFLRWANELGKANQAGLLAAGIGIERLLDILADQADEEAGRETGTPRAIEGPLYVPGAPLSHGEARLDDGSETGTVLVMEGVVKDPAGKPVAGAIVDIWQANQQGTYSMIDPTQTPYNYRRRIETDTEGRYRFRSLVPPGYAVPPDSPTQVVLDLLGRHGNRPAHIHFMVSAPGHEKLTTQVNIPNDQFLNDDFAFATREDLIVTLEPVDDPAEIARCGLFAPFTHVTFDFTLAPGKEAPHEPLHDALAGR